MERNIGFTSACQFAQDGRTLFGFCKEGVGEALEFAPLFLAWPGVPELIFVFADGVCTGAPGGGNNQGFSHMAVEEGVAFGQELDLARGVPPAEDQCILGCVFVDGGSQGGQFA